MKKLNVVRTEANGLLLENELNSTDIDFQYVEKFTLDWNFYNGKLPSNVTIEHLHL